jgi:parvulin-like peptidyl-prolyl isomerase
MAAMRWLGCCVGIWFAATAWGQSVLPTKPIAVVNGEPLSREEFENIWDRLPKPMTKATPEVEQAQRLELLNLLIDETLFQQFLKKTVPSPDPALVQQRIGELDRSLKAKGKSLEEYYKETGQSPARMQRDIAAVIQWNAYVKKHVTEEQLKQCYEDHRELLDGVMIRASHIYIPAERNAEPKTHQTAVQQLQSLRQELLQGTDFAALAKQHSQDRNTAKNGGDLGYFPPSRKDKDPFLRTVSHMKVGELSNIVQTDYGYHLIKVTERKTGKPTTFDGSKDDARVLAAEDLRVAIMQEQRQKAKIEINWP